MALKHPVCNWRLSKRLPWAKGNSSLSRLRHFPTDTLKIDRAFISRIDTDADNRAIVSYHCCIGAQFRPEGGGRGSRDSRRGR
ncbi:MAG: hypothetical protein DMG75_05120 [Acidobacteria bacterium]|nr:MAG: hypothetical protein DMG75_05120 [Acidobacteriota bacterium]